MILTSEKKKLGRPKKVVTGVPNSSDASYKRIDAYAEAIFIALTGSSEFAEYFKAVSESERKVLANKLAHEIAFFPALHGLVSSTALKRRGPRPKADQAIFLAQIKQVLKAYNVKIPVWRNARESKEGLLNFCNLLATATKTEGFKISGRTVARAPSEGFQRVDFGLKM